MEDDGFLKDVELAYQDCLRQGVTLDGDDSIWEFAKERAKHRHFLQGVVDKAKREGRDYDTVLREERERVAQEQKRQEREKLN